MLHINKEHISTERLSLLFQLILLQARISLEEQHILLSKQQLTDKNIEFIQSNPRFTFGYNKLTNIVTLEGDNMTKIIQNTAGLKRYVIDNVTYPYGYEGVEYKL